MKDKIDYILIDKIKPCPFQPREFFDEERMEELSESIKEKGLLEPIIVRKKGATYEIIAGERRWRSYQLAKLKEIPTIIKDVEDVEAKEISLIENWHRIDLEPNEKEKFVYNLWKEGEKRGRYKSIAAMARKIGIREGTLKELIYAHEERKEIATSDDLTYTDFRAVRGIKEDKKLWKELLKKRKTGKVKSYDLQKTAKVLKGSSKVKEAVKQGYASIDEVIKLSTRNLEPEEVEEKIMEKEQVVSEIETQAEINCPVCNKKLKIIHKEPEGHKVIEIEED